jgi:hypothetical protein
MMTAEQKGLRFAAGVTMAFGLALALAAFPPLGAPMILLADILVWPLDGAETGTAPGMRLILAIAGGVMAGWGWLIWQLAGAALAKDPDNIRPFIRQSVILWFVVDSIASVLASAPLNAVANLAFLALFLIPMLRGRAAQAA